MKKLTKISVPRFILRWLLIGWWAVPLLGLLVLLCALLDFGGWWDGEKWCYDEKIFEVSSWAFDKAELFFNRAL
jgi:hypothetical protein